MCGILEDQALRGIDGTGVRSLSRPLTSRRSIRSTLETLAAGAICLRGDISSIVPQPDDNGLASGLFPPTWRMLWKKCTNGTVWPPSGGTGGRPVRFLSAGPWVEGGPGQGARLPIPGGGGLLGSQQ